MDKKQRSILNLLSERDLKSKINKIDAVYHITEDRQTRQKMLLALDELKIELQKREKND